MKRFLRLLYWALLRSYLWGIPNFIYFCRDSKKERGRVLTGRYSHWCYEWDGLTIDETCDEWRCECAKELEGKYGR